MFPYDTEYDKCPVVTMLCSCEQGGLTLYAGVAKNFY